jgi:DNA-binding transcriptional LysR family regulator
LERIFFYFGNNCSMKEIDLLSLRYLVAVCDTGSVTRAAAQEHIVASTISKRLAQLEEDFGVALFERQQKRLRPTPAGETLLDHARALLSNTSRIRDDMAAYSAGIRGQVHLLASVSAISECLPDDVAAFMNLPEHREIKVDIEEAVSRDIVKRIREGSARVGILWDGSDLEDLHATPYRSDHLAVVTHPSHPLAKRRRCEFAETLDWQHVGLTPASAANLMQARAAALTGKRIQYRSVVSNFESAVKVVRANLGISIIPLEIAQTYQDTFNVRAIPLTDAWARRQFFICQRSNEALPKAAELLVQFLARAAT